MSWPALAYVFGTWGYALEQARALAAEHHQRVRLYRSTLNAKAYPSGQSVWVVDWEVQR